MAISRKLHETFSITRYSGVALSSEVCPFSISLYPSDDFKNIYTTNNAIVFSISVVLIFSFVTFVFFIYDANVERRQKVVLNSAEKTEAIVSSLFPSVIRDQMLQLDGNQEKLMSTSQPFGSHNIENPSQAMAALYPETTICFADLAGFTAWSR
jgi:hypothetical protein